MRPDLDTLNKGIAFAFDIRTIEKQTYLFFLVQSQAFALNKQFSLLQLTPMESGLVEDIRASYTCFPTQQGVTWTALESTFSDKCISLFSFSFLAFLV